MNFDREMKVVSFSADVPPEFLINLGNWFKKQTEIKIHDLPAHLLRPPLDTTQFPEYVAGCHSPAKFAKFLDGCVEELVADGFDFCKLDFYVEASVEVISEFKMKFSGLPTVKILVVQ